MPAAGPLHVVIGSVSNSILERTQREGDGDSALAVLLRVDNEAAGAEANVLLVQDAVEVVILRVTDEADAVHLEERVGVAGHAAKADGGAVEGERVRGGGRAGGVLCEDVGEPLAGVERLLQHRSLLALSLRLLHLRDARELLLLTGDLRQGGRVGDGVGHAHDAKRLRVARVGEADTVGGVEGEPADAHR